MFPMNNEKSRGLIVQVQILAQQTPYSERSCVRIAGIVSKRLNVADRRFFHGQDSFKWRTRAHSAVMIDGQDALPEMEGIPGMGT